MTDMSCLLSLPMVLSASLLIVFDDVRGPDLGLVRILPGRPQGASLTQQVPALIELDLDRLQTCALFLGEGLLFLEPVLLRDQLFDVPEHGSIGHFVRHSGPLFASPTEREERRSAPFFPPDRA